MILSVAILKAMTNAVILRLSLRCQIFLFTMGNSFLQQKSFLGLTVILKVYT